MKHFSKTSLVIALIALTACGNANKIKGAKAAELFDKIASDFIAITEEDVPANFTIGMVEKVTLSMKDYSSGEEAKSEQEQVGSVTMDASKHILYMGMTETSESSTETNNVYQRQWVVQDGTGVKMYTDYMGQKTFIFQDETTVEYQAMSMLVLTNFSYLSMCEESLLFSETYDEEFIPEGFTAKIKTSYSSKNEQSLEASETITLTCDNCEIEEGIFGKITQENKSNVTISDLWVTDMSFGLKQKTIVEDVGEESYELTSTSVIRFETSNIPDFDPSEFIQSIE